MGRPEIGVNLDDFGLHPKEGLRRAADLRFRAIELATVRGELAPSRLLSSGRRHLRRLTEGLGLELSALAADMPGLRLTDPSTVDERVSRTVEIIDLAKDLQVPVVSTAIGALTHPESGEPSPLGVEALQRIGEVADSRGVRFALRPSLDDGERLAGLLATLRCPSLGVGLDPAAMVMVGTNPMSVLERLAEHVVLLHARDGQVGRGDRGGVETRLGEGHVDLVGLVAAMEGADYAGPYVIRRTESSDPLADIEHARAVLQGLLPPAL